MLDRPLFWCAGAFAAGVASGGSILPPAALVQAAATLLAGSLALALRARTTPVLRSAGALAAGGFLLAGCLAVRAEGQPDPAGIATLLARHPALFDGGVDLEGTLPRPPATRATSPREGRSAHERTQLLVDLRRVRLARRWVPVSGRVRLTLPGDGSPREEPLMRRGSLIEAFARLSLPRRYGNPGSFDFPRFLQARRIAAIGTIKSARLLRERPGAAAPPVTRLLVTIDSLRDALLDRNAASFGKGERPARARGVAAALLLGERDDLGPGEMTLLQETGLSHLLAVSGFNVAVLAGMIYLLARAAGWHGRRAALLAIPSLLIYLLLNREETSVVRAVTMAVVLLAGRLSWRRPDALNGVGLAALVILARDPSQLHDPGFQLTFVATLSLLAGAVPLAERMAGRRPGGVRRRGAQALAVSLVAAAGTLPLTILHFHRVTWVAVASNLIAGPLMAAAFVLAVALQVVGLVSDGAAHLAALAITRLVDATFLVAETARSIPWASWRRPDPPGALIAACYLAMAGALVTTRRRWTAACLVLAGAATVLLILPLDTRRRPEGLRVTAIDVGQGDAILVETSAGFRMLVDAGGTSGDDFDLGERVVSPALWRMGIATIDRLVITHPDADHAGGAVSVLRNFRPAEVWIPPGTASSSEVMRRLADRTLQEGAALREIAGGRAACLPGARLSVLGPPADPRPAPDNDVSLVLEIRAGGRGVLLMGDAGQRVEPALDPRPGPADLLKTGHHGSRDATGAGLLRLTRPRVALVTCGWRNRFGHPHPEVLARLRAAGARVCRTDLHGMVEVELLGGSARATRLGESCALASSAAGRRGAG